VATSILAATERVGATFRRKKKYLLLGATEEVTATVRVRGILYSKKIFFKGLTNIN
jgi:hypothetical protein